MFEPIPCSFLLFKVFLNSGFTRTLCGGQWQALSLTSELELAPAGRLGCCSSGTFMAQPNSNPFTQATACENCPVGRTNDVENDDTGTDCRINTVSVPECTYEGSEGSEGSEGGKGGEGGEGGPGITLEKRLQWALPPPSVTFCVEASQNDQQSSLAENGGVNSLVVFWPTTNVLKKYMLGEEAAEEEEKDTGETGDTGETTLTEQQEQRAAAALVWVWYSPSAITVTATDARHEYYCVGTSDGSVFVLNIQTGIPFAVPRRHVSPKGQVRKRGVACLDIIEHHRPVIDQ